MEVVKALFTYNPGDACEQNLDSATTAQIQTASLSVSHHAE